MNITLTPSANRFVDSSVISKNLPSFMMKHNSSIYEEHSFEFSTIDGDVVTYRDGATAVNSGAGILIGDYFVGITDADGPFENSSVILY